MKKISFETALEKAQSWVGSHGIYAVGESKDDKGNKLIMIFTSDIQKTTEVIPKDLDGYPIVYMDTDEIKTQK